MPNFIITGGARGIGRGLTRLLIKNNHRVFVIDKSQTEIKAAEAIFEQYSTTDNRVPTKQAFLCKCFDLADASHHSQIVQTARDFFAGHIDVLINNAMATPHVWSDGRSMCDGADDSTEDDVVMSEWNEKLAVGLTAVFGLTRCAVPYLKASEDWDPVTSSADTRRPGTVINISSTRAHQAEADHEGYSAVKAGLLGLTSSMAVSLGQRYKIRVNAIVPGWISVDEENAVADGKGAKWGDGLTAEDHAWHLNGRVGKLEDVYKAVMFLVESDFVTGTEIVLDGGVSKRMVYPE